ncbi:MAG: gamma carbonic anhydrase family protein [Rhizobiales bacterium]|nr:gamma carbonic anhydrase family protein [Hyphomicrobiales bacterium]NRB15764.1 gamma carbonic anhydrase family protein [Hyphomicrobiales bacterium]
MSIYKLDNFTPIFTDRASCFVADSADIIGEVIIGRNVGIWFGAVLRGDTELLTIKDNSNIQDGTIIHADAGFPATIGMGCTIGHKAIIHGCTIHDNSLIGMAATVLNGAVIGENCLIGAGALVPEGKVIPPKSLVVGMPGKVRRDLTDDEVAGLTKSAEHYMQNASRFIQNLNIIVV